ncbi:MAG: alpha/beta hydrolase [Rhizobacter sp.]|jgi:pimeloyl-ACP methyl ester carboxylesterase|nr:alpha/beta hydrolase [Rhizobacter sp.]MBP6268778.1 alpha/beta hydrolase [Rhizobacter sp.]
MNTPRLHHVPCLDTRGLHRTAYWEWGDPSNPRVLVCVHGLTRQGRDFDVLAAAMSDRYRVVCPDIAGRGESDRLTNPMEYGIPRYVADMVTVLARVHAETLHWVGTSMGGLIGLGLAALAASPVSRLVLNDVGPVLEAKAIARIGAYLGLPLRWDSVEQAADYLLTISKGFGPHTAEQWLALTRPMLRPAEDGGVHLHYDPALAAPFKVTTPEMAAAGEAALWHAYDAITCPTLLLRGADSDLLTAETAAAMTLRGPRARLHQFDGVGHAPTLVAPDQVQVVREFLLSE